MILIAKTTPFAIAAARLLFGAMARIVPMAIILLLPVAASAEPIKLKLAFFTSDRSDAYQTVVKPFVDAVNAKAGGLLEIQVYFSGALGKDQAKTAPSVLDGTADIAFVVTGLAPNLFYDNTIMELPGLFKDAREATLVFTRLIAANALKGYRDFFTIGAYATAPETIHIRPAVASLDDLVGKKIGTNNNTEAIALKKLGMHPVILPVNEYAEAISNNRIDGVSKSPLILFDFGIARVATYHYLLGSSPVPLTLLMNRKKFNGLSKPAQDMIREYSGEWAAARFVETYDVANNLALQKLRSDPRRKVIVPSPADLKTAQAAFKSVISEWAGQSSHNRELLRITEAELAKIRSTP